MTKRLLSAGVFCGLPGSGKSTLARNTYSLVIETDDFFINDKGEYVFEPSKIGEAHKWNLRRWIDLCSKGVSGIAVANTNTTIEEAAPYIAVAEAFGYDVLVTVLDVPVDVCAERNVHGVPKKAIERMAARLSSLNIPSRWNVKKVSCEELGV